MFISLVIYLVLPVIVVTNVCHRLCDWDSSYPENTIECLQETIDTGRINECAYIEYDIHCTKDSRLIVHHDKTVQGYRIKDTPFRELRDLRIKGCQMPTPYEVLDTLKGFDKKIAIEVKNLHSDKCRREVSELSNINNVMIISTRKHFKESYPRGCELIKYVGKVGKHGRNLCKGD